MANLLSIVSQKQMPIDEEKLRILCSRENVWDHFGLDREVFSTLSGTKQLQMVRKFHFDNLPNFSKLNTPNIDSSTESAIQNSSGLTMRKVIERSDGRTEMTVDTVNSEEKVKKSINLCENFGYFGTESCDFSIEKANLPKNTLFYINQAYQSFKDGKNVYYTDVFIMAQIMPLAHQPKEIESYELNDNEVKYLRYGSDKELPPTFSLWEIYQYSDSMLKHLPSDSLKTIAKTLLYDKQPVYFADTTYARRNHNANCTDLTRLNAAAQAAKKLPRLKM